MVVFLVMILLLGSISVGIWCIGLVVVIWLCVIFLV